jgi:hypothetical protein
MNAFGLFASYLFATLLVWHATNEAQYTQHYEGSLDLRDKDIASSVMRDIQNGALLVRRVSVSRGFRVQRSQETYLLRCALEILQTPSLMQEVSVYLLVGLVSRH